MMSIQKPAVAEHSEDRVQDNPFVGKTIVVTGKVEPYTRDGINDLIESLAPMPAARCPRRRIIWSAAKMPAASCPRPGIWALRYCHLRSSSAWPALSKKI